MRTFSIKSIVSIANISLYTAITLIFIAIKVTSWNLSLNTAVKLGYVFLVIALLIFVLYWVLRSQELKKTKFQLLPKHKLFMAIFYYGELFLIMFSLLYIILVNVSVLKNNQISVFWYVWFPLVFIISIIISVLESIVRVEEKIFIAKENWIASQKWEAEQKKAKQNNKLNKNNLKNNLEIKENLVNNPFFEKDKNSKKINEDTKEE